MSLLEPDRLFSKITAIDISKDLLNVGLNAVLLDIDNTIRSRDTDSIPRDVGLWIAKARNAGVKFCLLSNNWHQNVFGLARELELPIVAKACKPLPFAYGRALALINTSPRQAVAVGDQLFTDVVGAHLAGVTAYMVMPLAEADLKHTLMLRNIERVFIVKLEPEPVPAPAQSSASAQASTPVQASASAQASAPVQSPTLMTASAPTIASAMSGEEAKI